MCGRRGQKGTLAQKPALKEEMGGLSLQKQVEGNKAVTFPGLGIKNKNKNKTKKEGGGGIRGSNRGRDGDEGRRVCWMLLQK